MKYLFYEEIEPNHFVMHPQNFFCNKDADEFNKYYYIKDGVKIPAQHLELPLYDKTIIIDCPENMYSRRVIWDYVMIEGDDLYKVKIRLLDGSEIDTLGVHVQTGSYYAGGILAVLNTFGYNSNTTRWYGRHDKHFYRGDWLVRWYTSSWVVCVEVPTECYIECISCAYSQDKIHPCGLHRVDMNENKRRWEFIDRTPRDAYCNDNFLFVPICQKREEAGKHTYKLHSYNYYAKYNLLDCINLVLCEASLSILDEDLFYIVFHKTCSLVREGVRDVKRKLEVEFNSLIENIPYEDKELQVEALLCFLIQMKQKYDFNLYEYYEQRECDY